MKAKEVVQLRNYHLIVFTVRLIGFLSDGSLGLKNWNSKVGSIDGQGIMISRFYNQNMCLI